MFKQKQSKTYPHTPIRYKSHSLESFAKYLLLCYSLYSFDFIFGWLCYLLTAQFLKLKVMLPGKRIHYGNEAPKSSTQVSYLVSFFPTSYLLCNHCLLSKESRHCCPNLVMIYSWLYICSSQNIHHWKWHCIMLTLPLGMLTLNIMLMQHHDSPEGSFQGNSVWRLPY